MKYKTRLSDRIHREAANAHKSRSYLGQHEDNSKTTLIKDKPYISISIFKAREQDTTLGWRFALKSFTSGSQEDENKKKKEKHYICMNISPECVTALNVSFARIYCAVLQLRGFRELDQSLGSPTFLFLH